MNKIFKKLGVLLLIVFSIITSNVIKISAYSDDVEESEINFDSEQIEESVQKRLDELNLRRNYSKDKFTVVIDAGHGGKDSGAVNSRLKMYEKVLNLDIAKSVKKRLESYGINVVMTRETDVFVELKARPELANAINADMFVSLHNDTSEGSGYGAYIIYICI